MLANTKRVVDAARAAGVTVMHAPITFAKGYGELSARPYGILKRRRWPVLREGQLGSRHHR
jgi:nicotinamidase-related amidase